MAWTQATPNGGNSAYTGQKNKNNNASAEKQTRYFGGGNKTPTPVYSSPHEQGQSNNTPTPKKAPTPIYSSPHEQGGSNNTPTPVYPSPNEQGQNNNAPIPETGSQGVVITPQPDSVITQSELPDKDYLSRWALKLEGSLNGGLKDNRSQIDSNKDSIKENLENINDNYTSTGGQIDDLKKIDSGLYSDFDLLGDDLTDTQSNLDAFKDDTLGARSDQAQQIAANQEEMGIISSDKDAAINDVSGRVDANAEVQMADQKSDLIARDAQQSSIDQAIRQVAEEQGDINEETVESFRATDRSIAEMVTELASTGLDMLNITSGISSEVANNASEADKKDKYDQKYWSSRLKELKASGQSESDVQKQLKTEMSKLKDKTYSGDTVITEEDHITAWADLNSSMYDLGLIDASPHAPKEYMYESFLNNIDQWVADGKVSVETTTSGMFDENTTNTYTLPDGQQVITKGSSPMFTDEDGKEFRFGNDTLTMYMDGVELGSSDGDVTTVTKQGEANHVDSTVRIGDDANPNSEGNRPNDSDGEPAPEPEVVEEEPTDPVVGEDIPLPKDLTDPDGAGAYGQDGRAFTLDGVTYWKRIKARNGRWTYARLDSFQSQGTSSRRSSWGENVQNF